MSGEERKDQGYETRDAHAGSTLKAGILLLVAMFLVAAIVVPLYRLLVKREALEQPRPATLIRARPSPTVGPLLVTDEPAALAAFRAKEDAILDGYAWVEKDQGVARMPIAEAMRIAGARGSLPEFPAPSPSPAAPGAPAAGGSR